MQNNAKNQENETNNVANRINRGKKIKVKIPVNPLNPTDLIIPIQINGYKWICRRGEEIVLPKECVKLLTQAGYLR